MAARVLIEAVVTAGVIVGATGVTNVTEGIDVPAELVAVTSTV